MTDTSRRENAPDTTGLAGRRFLVVSLYYRPEETGIAPYSSAVAEYLAAQGASVTALTALPHYPEWRVFADYRKRLVVRERLHGVDVRRFRVFVPRRQTAVRRAAYEATFLAPALASGLGPLDAVIAVVPNLSGAFVGAWHARRNRCPFGVIVQDLTGPAAAQAGVKGGDRVARATKAAEALVFRQADRVAIVSEGFRQYLVAGGVPPERIDPLPNWSRLPKPERTRAEARSDLGWDHDDTVVLHAGNMGLKQGLEHVMAAAREAHARGRNYRFVFMGDGSQRAALQVLAADLPNVEFIPPRYGTDFADALTAADILLVNERSSVVDMSLPSKLTAYFMAGRPVVAGVALDGVTAREIRRSSGGRSAAAENPEALIAVLDEVAGDHRLSEALGRGGSAYAEDQLSEAASLRRVDGFAARLLGSR